MSSSRPTRGLARLAVAGTAVLLLTACGASGSESGDAPSSASPAQSSESSTTEPSTSASSSSASSTSPSSTSEFSTSAPPTTDGDADAVTLDAPDAARGHHSPAIRKGRGNAVIAIRHHPADEPVRAVIVNQGASDFTARIQTGTGPDATVLDSYRNTTRGPVELGPEATAIRIESSGRWIVKLLPRHH